MGTKLVVVLLTLCSVYCDKVFKSIPVTVKSYENDTVLLPCYIHDTDTDIRVRWYKDEDLLGDSRDAHLLLPPRTRLHANYSLQIDGLTGGDTAHYTCEVIRPEPWGPITQTHAIEVQSSPVIRTIPEDGFLEVRKGDYVDIGCEASGTPQPFVTWKKNGEPMALLEHRHRIKFKAEHRLLAGVFRCIAENGVGDAVTADIRVIIHDAPVVTAIRSFVHTAVGLRAALAARVEFAAPPARVTWYRDGRAVHTDDRVHKVVQDNVHQLIFRRVQARDLGNYTFRAENKLGMADVSFKLTGVPNVASFKVDTALNRATSTGFTLIWEVDSYSNIIEYNLWLRPYYGRLATEPDSFTTQPPTNLWHKIVVPGDTTDGPIHSATYTVRGLTASTVYEALVTSRNSICPSEEKGLPVKCAIDSRTQARLTIYTRQAIPNSRFGWSKPSSVLHFATEPGAGNYSPVTHDYNDYPIVLEDPMEQAHNLTQAMVSSGSAVCPAAILIFVSFNVIGRFC